MKMNKRHTFTALELVLVITISAILLSISLPAFYNISQGRRTTAALTDIAANISLARARAVSENIHTALIFNADGDFMRLATVHKYNTTNFNFERWLDDSSWERIGEGVYIPPDTGSPDANFYEKTGASSKADPLEVKSTDFSEIGGGAAVNTKRAIIINPRGQILTTGSPITPIVIRVAEGVKVPGSSTIHLKTTEDKVTYARLTVNPLSCRTEVDYVSE